MNRIQTTRLFGVFIFLCLVSQLLAAPPNIVMQPANKRTYSGAHVMFSVYSDSTDALTYQWMKNGDAITGATDPRLVLRNVSDSDVASYSVQVSNGTETNASSAATLTLYAAGNVIEVPSYASAANSQLTSLRNIKAVVNGSYHGMALGEDGKLFTFGPQNPYFVRAGFNIYSFLPQGLTNASAIAVDDQSYGFAVDTKGSLRWWSFAASRELPVPAEAHDVVAIAATAETAVALRADGKVVCWAFMTNYYVAPFVPDIVDDAVAISATYNTVSVLHRDGTVVTWNRDGLVTFAEPVTNAIAIDQGSAFGMARLADQRLVVWEPDYAGNFGYSNEPLTNAVFDVGYEPANTVEICAGDHPMTLSEDGSLHEVFYGGYPIAGLGHVNHLTSSDGGLLFIRNDDTPVIFTQYGVIYFREVVGKPGELSVPVAGRRPFTYQWLKGDRVIAGATSSTLRLTGRTNDAGAYFVVVKNRAGSTTGEISVSVVKPSTAMTVAGDSKPVRTTNDTVVIQGAFPADAWFNAFQQYGYFYSQADAEFVTNGSTVKFTLTANLAPGSNVFTFDLEGLEGEQSIRREFFRVVKSPFTLNITGAGTVAPALGGELEIGATYTLRATPAPGRFFSYWTANDWTAFGYSSDSTTLQFTMVSNLVITAAFEASPFPQVHGVYRGLFYPYDGVDQETSGYAEVTLSASGAFSGKLVQGADVHRFSGSFMKHPANYSGGEIGAVAQVLLPRRGKVPLAMTLYRPYDVYSGGYIGGYLTDNYASAYLSADKSVYNPQRAGQYTIAFGSNGDGAVPYGNSYATVRVDAFGGLTMVGSLSDGTSISQSTGVSRVGMWPLYVPLYNGTGSLISWVPLSKWNFQAPMSWTRPADTTTGLFKQGFTNENHLVGSAYLPAGNVFNNGTVTATLQTADGAINLTDPVSFSSAGVPSVDPSSGDQLQLKVNRAAGLFSGSFVAPDTHETVNIRGAILTGQIQGAGYFLRSNQSGAVSIQLPP